MGTRNLTCVVMDNSFRIAQYGQYDGYPAGQGAIILEFLKGFPGKKEEEFRKKLDLVRFYTEEEMHGFLVRHGMDGPVPTHVAESFYVNHPELYRSTGARILDLVYSAKKPVKLCNNILFAANSAWCEWAYVVDMDQRCLDVYSGFNYRPVGKANRFHDLPLCEVHSGMKQCYPVRRIRSYGFDNLPDPEMFRGPNPLKRKFVSKPEAVPDDSVRR